MAISAQDVKRLRDMTGAGMMDCKEALTENAGDFDAAVDFLRKKGLSKAAKKADRATNEGLVHSIVAADATSGALVEVNCETDFVARNEQFVGLVQLLTQKTLDAPAGATPDAAWLLAEKFPGSDMTVQDALAAQIAKIGENMRVARAVRYIAGTNAVVRSYIHPGARVGVLIEAAAGKADTLRNPSFESWVRDMAMQVAAASPAYVTRDQADPAVVEHERAIFRGQMEGSGKPAPVIEKIVEGKLEKYYSEVCLVEQDYIRDQDKKVRDVLDETGKALGDSVRVVRFARYALGEGA